MLLLFGRPLPSGAVLAATSTYMPTTPLRKKAAAEEEEEEEAQTGLCWQPLPSALRIIIGIISACWRHLQLQQQQQQQQQPAPRASSMATRPPRPVSIRSRLHFRHPGKTF